MLKMCGLAEDTRSFACGLLVALSAFTSERTPQSKAQKVSFKAEKSSKNSKDKED